MNEELSKNIYKERIKKFKKYECGYYLQKNGTIKYFQDINYTYKRYLCILNDILKFDGFKLYIFGKNQDDIIENLLLLNYLKTQNLKYIILKKKTDEIIFVFKEKNKDAILNILFLLDLLDNNNFNMNNINLLDNSNNFDSNKVINLLILLSIEFFIYKSKYTKITNQKVLIYLFYKIYIYKIEEELNKKFNYNLNNFENYKVLYNFLKEKGYVNIFYNIYGPIIINNQKKIHKYLFNHPYLKKFKLKFESNKSLIKNFSEINLTDIIDKKLFQNFNKVYIKNKFLELTKKI
jgi:hypothetical protein